jgi:hypothetical protein
MILVFLPLTLSPFNPSGPLKSIAQASKDGTGITSLQIYKKKESYWVATKEKQNASPCSKASVWIYI